MEYEIVCKDLGYPHEGGTVIIRLGIQSPGSTTKTVLTKGEVIDMMLKKHDFFYVNRAGFKAYLVMQMTANGHEFVETLGDKTKLDNLYALPTCTKDEIIGQSAGGADPDDNGPDYDPGGSDADPDDANPTPDTTGIGTSEGDGTDGGPGADNND